MARISIAEMKKKLIEFIKDIQFHEKLTKKVIHPGKRLRQIKYFFYKMEKNKFHEIDSSYDEFLC